MPIRRQYASDTGRGVTAFAVAAAIAVLLMVASFLALRPGPAGASTTTVYMGGYSYIYDYYWFCDASHNGNVCTTTIQVGDTVTWQNISDTPHTSTDTPVWESGPVGLSGTYSRQFNQVGTFSYHCNIHPTQMLGQIVVLAAPTSTPTPTPTPTSPPSVGGVAFDAGGTGSGGTSGGLLAGIAAGAAIALALGGAAWWAKRVASR